MRKRLRYILLAVILVGIATVVLRVWLREPHIAPGSYVQIDLGGEYVEAPPQDLIGRLLHSREHTLIDVLTTIRKAQVDERIKGLIVRVTTLETGWAKVQDLRDALVAFKKSGKPMLALLEKEASSSNKEYYLGSVADRVYLAPSATAPLNGLAAQFLFLGGVWDKLDIQMTVEKIREYKTFGDMIGNREMTPAHREMANSLLDSINAQFIAGIAQSRGLEPETVQTLIEQCPVSPAEFETAHLSNGSKYLQDLQDELGADTKLVPMNDYMQVRAKPLGLNVGPQIAVVYGVGAIVPGESGSSLQGELLGADTVSEALADAAADDDAKAIVFRVDSPGGSALASDLVWRATQAARKKKPVIVSMSDVAGSGGYYISAGANRIVAQPATMTGSIGVVFVRPNIKGMLARLGITTESITRGKFAALDDLTTALSDEGRRKLVAEMDHIYDVFVERVASGRGMTTERVNDIGRGRVWTGAQAKENGLVDELGGFAAAIQAAKQAAGIDASKEVELVFYPQPKSLVERLGQLLGARATIDVPAPWRRALQAVTLPFEDGALLTLMRQIVDVR